MRSSSAFTSLRRRARERGSAQVCATRHSEPFGVPQDRLREESGAFASGSDLSRAKAIASIHEAILGRRSGRRCITRRATRPRRGRRQSCFADAAFLHATGSVGSLVAGRLLASLLLRPNECVVSRRSERIGAIQTQRRMHRRPVEEVAVKKIAFDAARADCVIAAVEICQAVLGGSRRRQRDEPQERREHRLNRSETKRWTKVVASHRDTHFDSITWSVNSRRMALLRSPGPRPQIAA
jgi:hypothetical protein